MKMRYLACLTVAVAILLAAPASVAASDHPGFPQVYLEARPSSACFPASALEQAELEKDFARFCRDCSIVSDDSKPVDYRLIVEDPGFGWKLSVYDGFGRLVETLKWDGSLDRGLTEAASLVHSQEP